MSTPRVLEERTVIPLNLVSAPAAPSAGEIAAALLEVPLVKVLLQETARASVHRQQDIRRRHGLTVTILAAIAVISLALLGATGGPAGVHPMIKATLLGLGLGTAFAAGRVSTRYRP